MKPDQVAIGIDLGTTNSCVALVEQGKPRIIPNRSGYSLTPSVVAFTEKGERLIGQMAKRQAVINPSGTLFACKRLLGRRWDSTVRERIQEVVPYQLVPGPHNDIRILVGSQVYSPAEIGSIILMEMKKVAEDYLGFSVKNAVITVPAYFNDAQRQATKDAGRMAGLDVLRILNEPTAAALVYGLGKTGHRRVAVYDLGGGTFDISVLEMKDGVYEVLSTAGDTFLGGEDFDLRVIEWLNFAFAKEHKIDLRKNLMALQRLKEASEKARHDLSTLQETEIQLPFLIEDAHGRPCHLQKTLSREKLESLSADLIDRTIRICKKTLDDVSLKPKDIDEVLLVGGMTRMPRIQEAVARFFNKPPSKGVHPDEVVALGAAVQAAALMEQKSSVVLLDVTPHSLGIMIAGGYYQILIEQNTSVPCSRSHIFTTVRDFQTEVKILVLQGESFQAAENELLGAFVLDGLRPAPRGEVQIEVKFSISADGIVSVAAKDILTGYEQSIVVESTNRLSEDEIHRMLEENRDQALATKTSEEFDRQRSVAEMDLRQIEIWLPQIEEIVQSSPHGQDALRKAIDILERTKASLATGDLPLLLEQIPTLQRTRKLFQQILDHSKKGS